MQQNDDAPDRFRQLLAAIGDWNAAGADVKAQVAVRPIGVLIGLQATANPFMFCPSYRQLHTLTHGERIARLRDPDVRRTLLDEHAASSPSGFVGILHSGYDRMYPLSDPPDYEPTPADSVAGRAAAAGADPDELLYDLLLDDDGSRLLYIPLMNYARGDLADVREMLTSPNAMFGLSDAGAHCNSICDGSFPTTAITHWTRDRVRGEQLPLEYVVHQQTQRTARHVGWTDRGVVAPGMLADLNVIDHDRLTLHPPVLVADLPAGGTRLMQAAEGYVATIKRGDVIAEHGELTGARPGRLQPAAPPNQILASDFVAALAVAFGVVFVAELGDKTQLLALDFGARYSLRVVAIGLTLGYGLANIVATIVGGILGAALPDRPIQILGGSVFLGFAALAVRRARSEPPDETEAEHATPVRGTSTMAVVASIATLIAVAEMGDKTQIATATLASQSSPVGVWVGATLGAASSGMVGAVAGNLIGDRIPARALQFASAALFTLFGVAMLVGWL